MELVIHPNDILRTDCKDLKEKPSESFLREMWAIVKDKNGVGLAAPQIGESINLFVINQPKNNLVFINPRILSCSAVEIDFEEGCLSLPGELINIKRPQSLMIEYRDENFKQRKGFFDGLKARIIQHEYDHLRGKLIIDYLNKNDK